jgi:hypothetical protein
MPLPIWFMRRAFDPPWTGESTYEIVLSVLQVSFSKPESGTMFACALHAASAMQMPMAELMNFIPSLVAASAQPGGRGQPRMTLRAGVPGSQVVAPVGIVGADRACHRASHRGSARRS